MNPKLLPTKIQRCMAPADRKKMGIRLPEEAAAIGEVKYERELQKLCENYLRQNGIVYLHFSNRAREKIGWPDLVFAVKGLPIAVELKSPNGEVRPSQKLVMHDMNRNGWAVYVCRDFHGFESIIRNAMERKSS